jgi:multidrug resistance efflux pump
MSNRSSYWLLCAALALVAGCDRGAGDDRAGAAGKSQQPPGPVAVQTERVRVIPTQRYVPVTGTLHGDEDTAISNKVSGRIRMIHRDVSDAAGGGEPLAELDTTDYDLAVRQKDLMVRELLSKLGVKELPPPDFDVSKVPTVQRARLQADNAKAKLERGRKLHEQDPPLMSDQDFADLETAAKVAESAYDVELLAAGSILAEAYSRKADLDIAQQRLKDTVIRAPRVARLVTPPGTTRPTTQPVDRVWAVSQRMVSVGEFVREGTQLFRLIDDDPLKLRAAVPEKHGPEMRVGQRVELTVEGREGTFAGTISRINPQVQQSTRAFEIEAIVPNPGRKLKPGGVAKALVHTRMDDAAVYVPEKAIQTFAGVSRVFAVRDGKAAEVQVETGEKRGAWVEVKRGLAAKDEVVVAGANRVSNKADVTATPTTRPTAVTEIGAGGVER